MKNKALFPILAGFFVMGFGGIIGTVMFQIKNECASHADQISYLIPIFAYLWFVLISIPTGLLCGRIGRKKTVLLSLIITVAAMALAFVANAERWWVYVVAYALIGIGNTIIQAALPALMSNVVTPELITSRISLGQFVKAICEALTPVFVYLTATALGNWKLLFPLYGLLSVVEAIWLLATSIPDERSAARPESAPYRTTFGSCLAMLKHPYVLAMTVGILFSVGADVGFSVAIPEFLSKVYKVDVNRAAMGPTVYFVAKTIAALLGAIVFAKVSAAKCFPWCMGVGIVATAAILFVGTPFAFFVCIFVVALMTANSFGMCMGLAIDKVPDKTNEITALMVMAIVGGGIVSAVLGVAQKAFGAAGIVGVLIVCVGYLFLLGLFACVNGRGDTPGRPHSKEMKVPVASDAARPESAPYQGGEMTQIREVYSRYPQLKGCAGEIAKAFNILLSCYRNNGKVLTCGNGGSAADSEHIVGELLKKFRKHRDIDAGLVARLPPDLVSKLEGALPAISLVSMSGIVTAFANDVTWETVFAQQVVGLGRMGDVLIALSTSGNSANCVNAALVARAKGMKVIAMTGGKFGKLGEVADATIAVPEIETYKIQELHLPVYHALCAALEESLF